MHRRGRRLTTWDFENMGGNDLAQEGDAAQIELPEHLRASSRPAPMWTPAWTIRRNELLYKSVAELVPDLHKYDRRQVLDIMAFFCAFEIKPWAITGPQRKWHAQKIILKRVLARKPQKGAIGVAVALLSADFTKTTQKKMSWADRMEEYRREAARAAQRAGKKVQDKSLEKELEREKESRESPDIWRIENCMLAHTILLPRLPKVIAAHVMSFMGNGAGGKNFYHGMAPERLILTPFDLFVVHATLDATDWTEPETKLMIGEKWGRWRQYGRRNFEATQLVKQLALGITKDNLIGELADEGLANLIPYVAGLSMEKNAEGMVRMSTLSNKLNRQIDLPKFIGIVNAVCSQV